MANKVMFPNADGSSFVVHFDGDLIATDRPRRLVLFLDPKGALVVDEPAPGDLDADEEAGRHAVELDDDQAVQDYFSGTALQAALAKLYDVRAIRGSARRSADEPAHHQRGGELRSRQCDPVPILADCQRQGIDLQELTGATDIVIHGSVMHPVRLQTLTCVYETDGHDVDQARDFALAIYRQHAEAIGLSKPETLLANEAED